MKKRQPWSVKRGLKNVVVMLAVFYVTACATVAVKQRSLIYHPTPGAQMPEMIGLEMEAIMRETADGEKIELWYATAPEGRPTILLFHGNAGNLEHRKDRMDYWKTGAFGVLGVDYRGYGNSSGEPSEQGLYEDGRTAVNFLLEQGVPQQEIILYGVSLGSGVAVQMATEYPDAKLLVLEAPYSSLVSVAMKHYPWVPVEYLLFDRYDSISKIGDVHMPVLMFHGLADDIIPVSESKQLFEAANEPKFYKQFQRFGHNNLPLPQMTSRMSRFIEER